MSFKLSKILFFFLLIFCPLAFGTTEPWSYAIMETGAFAAAALFFIHIIKHDDKLYCVPGITALIIFLFYILIQMIPLPGSVVRVISPEAFKIYHTTRAITGTISWMPLTINLKATLSEFFRYASYVVFYALTVQLLSRKQMLRTTILVIAVFGGLLAFSSILQFYLTDDMALWFRYTPRNSIVVGPYVNHNHYAGLMEMIFPIVLGLFLFYRPKIGSTSILRGIAEIFNQEKANIHILVGTSALLIIVSIFVSLSRGAMISTCLSLIIFTFFLMQRKISRGNTMVIMAIIVLSALSIGWFGWDQIFERFAKLKNAQGIIYESRLAFWHDTKQIINHFKLTGAGLGSFSHIYPLFRSINSDRILIHAHNDYLELLAEGGIIAFLLAAWFLCCVFYRTYKIFKKRRDAFSIYIYIGSITAMASILFHSFTDFNMHIGANGLWFFLCAGIGVCAANTGLRKQSLPSRLPVISSGRTKLLSVAAIIVLTIGVSVFNISNLIGIFYYTSIKNYRMAANTPEIIVRKIEKIASLASEFDPLNAQYHFTIGNTAWFLKNYKKSESHFCSCLALDPVNPRYLNRFAIFLARTNKPGKAQTAFRQSVVYDPTSPEYNFKYAVWLFSRNKISQGLQYMRKALSLDEKFMERALTAMIVSGLDTDQITGAVPDSPGPLIAFADFLYETGKRQKAVDLYKKSLDLVGQAEAGFRSFKDKPAQKRMQRHWFFKIYNFFKHHNDLQNAMLALQRAETALPMDAKIKVALGDFYFHQGILYKARDKYDQALLLDPGNRRALKMIKKIKP